MTVSKAHRLPSSVRLGTAICLVLIPIVVYTPQAAARTLLVQRLDHPRLTSNAWQVGPPALSRPGDRTLEVFVYDYAGVPVRERERAEDEATFILSKAGLQTEWLVCVDAAGPADVEGGCPLQEDPARLYVRIIPRAARKDLPVTVVGMAPLTLGTEGEYATVFYDRVLSTAGSLMTEVPLVLGCILAHEIGHLLLGPESHSPEGIMRAQWSQEDLAHAGERYLGFSQAESKRLRLAVETRNTQELQLATYRPRLAKPAPAMTRAAAFVGLEECPRSWRVVP